MKSKSKIVTPLLVVLVAVALFIGVSKITSKPSAKVGITVVEKHWTGEINASKSKPVEHAIHQQIKKGDVIQIASEPFNINGTITKVSNDKVTIKLSSQMTIEGEPDNRINKVTVKKGENLKLNTLEINEGATITIRF